MTSSLKRIVFVLCALTMSATVAFAQWTKVWEQPAMNYNKWGNSMTITRVEMNDRYTTVSFHFWYPPTSQVGFDKNTVLRADGKEYAALSATGVSLGEGFAMPESGNIDFTLTFAPFPDEVASFDCLFPGFFTMENVHDRCAPKANLNDTYWRNAATGDWLIGFAEEALIYDSRLWDIVSCTEKKGEYDYTVRNANDELRIRVSKEKKGLRRIRIGNAKAIACNRITSRFMPPYPVEDNRPALADNGYRMGDSVTIIGWYKDMNERAWAEGREFSISVSHLCLPEESVYSTPIDSLGRFTLRFPVENTSQERPDWSRCRWDLILEPGETYFLLKDFATDQMLVMGRDARVQNEFLANEHTTNGVFYCPAAHEYVRKMGTMGYLAKADSAYQKELQRIVGIPNLSERYKMCHRNATLAEVAREIIQARFSDHNLPDEFLDYATNNIFNKLEGSYHIGCGSTPYFIEQYSQILEEKHQPPYTAFSEMMQILEKEGIASFSAEEWQTVNEYERDFEIVKKEIDEAKSDEERQLIADAFNAKPISLRMMELVKKQQEVINSSHMFFELKNYRTFLPVIDSLGWTQLQRDIYLSQSLCNLIDNTRSMLIPQLLDLAKTEIKLPQALDAVLSMHGKYENIAKKTLSTSSIYSNDDVAGLSEGEQILRKILEPMRGKMVLLDVWGTWCGPCKDALSHSQEEYERLKPYDIVYLYLANNSPDESWRNVIKQYNVQGDNVVHYNLPAAQQSAVENFLKVNSYPTYRLIDAEGHILDVNADPRNLDALERVIKQLTGK